MPVVRKSRHVSIREREEDRNDILRYNEVVYAWKEEVHARSKCVRWLIQTGQQAVSRKERRDLTN